MILDEIIKQTEEDLKKRKKEFPIEWLGRSLSYNNLVPRDVKPYLRSTKENPYRIIAEVKKASPSKGVIRDDFDPIAIAQSYKEGGADALSVLTEPHFFKGNLEYLAQIRRYVPTPLLRKDFIIDEYQILEAYMYGADFILLIAKVLSKKKLFALLSFAVNLGMEVLVEVHDKTDLLKAVSAGGNIIGINHRNLETFDMDMSLSQKLLPLIPKDKIIVAESGLNNKETIVNLSSIGVDAFLIGEHFMRQNDVGLAVREMKKV
ncbi:MAG: indole-3-glycerol phosphate synthase TrpC [Campylobacteraceae bacterium]|jgi:indole-3-glycerol phosphate synthase|nr:indole-3-glycerol phosphate synthase TrpC [Campylobacteraceae bacterium]